MVDSAMRDLERNGDHEEPEKVAAQMLIVAQKTLGNLNKAMAHATMGVGIILLRRLLPLRGGVARDVLDAGRRLGRQRARRRDAWHGWAEAPAARADVQ